MKLNNLKQTITLLVLLCGTGLHVSAQFYNGTQTTFGKNRVQYDDFEWQFYRFQEFETYFYTGGKELAQHTAYYANQRIKKLEDFLDYYLEERIQFIIYNKQSHFRQSNIGLSTDQSYNIGGVTRIVDSKVFLYYEGDYKKLEQQIDAGILRVLIYQMIFGGNWREVLRNSALLSLPEWYIEGLVSYLAYPDDPYINARIKDGILNQDFKKFNNLTNEEAKIAGHAMWKYIAHTYGDKVISNILYMTRLSREIDDGFLFVIGVSFEDLYREWYEYYNKEYRGDTDNLKALGDPVNFKVKKNRRYQNFLVSPDGNYQVYTTNRFGQYKIYLYDRREDKRRKIFKAEHKLERIQDYSYPIIRFHPSGKLISFIIENKGKVLLYNYNIEEKSLSAKPIFKIEKVLSYDYTQDGQQFVFSGIAKGQTDLYIYNILGNTQQKLTDDIYSDLNPVFGENDRSIFFASNRNNDSLNKPHQVKHFDHEKDIFIYYLDREESPIEMVTNSSKIDEYDPLVISNNLYYLQNKEGNVSRYQAEYDSTVSRIDTTVHYRYFYNLSKKQDLPRNILYQAAKTPLSTSQITYLNGKYALFEKTLGDEKERNEKERNKELTQFNEDSKIKKLERFDKIEPRLEVDISNYAFQNSSQKSEKGNIESSSINQSEEISRDLEFPTQRLYRLNFRTDNSVLQLNNMFINSQYQVFNGGPYINPGVGVNTKIGIVDLMENHRIYGSFRYSGDLIEYALSYQNLEKRLDKEYSFGRTRQRRAELPSPYDLKTLKATSSFIWPFSEVTSIRAVASARNDKVIPLSSDKINLEQDIRNEYWGSVKLAYVFDNTRDIALNIRYGTRFKIFAEQYQLLFSEAENPTSSDLSVFGFDFRHYQKIHRELIGVFRFAGSKSIGTNPLIYYLGGVDEWWRSDIFNDNTPIDQTENYGFQALAANMRGFLQNIRNGNNFAVINTELRWPVFSYFINRPIQSDFVRNFQLIGFGDVGTAWIGDSPFANDNPINNETRTTGPITVVYENINDPIVGGVGFGLRTTLLGYFVRADWGWGIENGEVADKPLFMFSLSLDI